MAFVPLVTSHYLKDEIQNSLVCHSRTSWSSCSLLFASLLTGPTECHTLSQHWFALSLASSYMVLVPWTVLSALSMFFLLSSFSSSSFFSPLSFCSFNGVVKYGMIACRRFCVCVEAHLHAYIPSHMQCRGLTLISLVSIASLLLGIPTIPSKAEMTSKPSCTEAGFGDLLSDSLASGTDSLTNDPSPYAPPIPGPFFLNGSLIVA